MTSLDIWAPALTEDIKKLAMTRILKGGNLATRVDLDQETIKVALILVRQLNDRERLTQDEEAILIGVKAETLRKLKADGIISDPVNW